MRSAMPLLALVVLAGCGPLRPAAAPAPLLGPDVVLAAHNAWAGRIGCLWSRAAVRINFPTGDEDGRRMQHDLDGHLFLDKPDCLYLHGQVLGQEVFTLGMNEAKFWLWIRPRINTVWVGSRGGAGERRLLVSPSDLLAALGLSPLALDAGARAVFVAQKRHYVLSEEREVGGAVVPRRRTWFDRATLRPVRIDLFDEAGRCLLMAELLRYEHAGETEVCTLYRARFYGDEEVDLVLRLSSVDLQKRPNPKVYQYRRPADAKERDLDAPREPPSAGRAPSAASPPSAG